MALMMQIMRISTEIDCPRAGPEDLGPGAGGPTRTDPKGPGGQAKDWRTGPRYEGPGPRRAGPGPRGRTGSWTGPTLLRRSEYIRTNFFLYFVNPIS